MAARQRVTGPHGLVLPPQVTAEIRTVLPSVADDVVGAIIAEVPSYTDALGGPMGETIRHAVQLALGGFLSLAGGGRRGGRTQGAGARSPRAPAVDGAYELGRGEARAGRSTDALLSAYRIGAQVSWREMSRRAVAAGLDAELLASFAELVFAYIDELSAASVAGHTDELATTGRVRQRLLERLATRLVAGDPPEAVTAAAERADWPPPTTLTAVVVPPSQARLLLGRISAQTLQAADAPGLDTDVLLLVPDAHGRRRARLLRTAEGSGAVVGPARPWLQARASYVRARRTRLLGLAGDTEEHLTDLVLSADPEALADLRAQALAPLADLRPAARDKLVETLRAWLLHQGRRDDVAAALFVHPQTVRYRLGQLREAYGDRLDDPELVLRLTLALGSVDRPAAQTGAGATSVG